MEDTGSQANKICIKIYSYQNEILVAACDAEILGKTLKDGEMEFHVSKEFYMDVLGDEEMLKRAMEKATIGNLVGSRTVKCGIEMGLIDEENILNIAGIPHAQFVLI
ncbi:MAG TPA: DUF424 family protein [Thermoplasmatales archaeon]|nr:DUF424 family protein [Thermoplasmatales archaeon]